MRFVDEFRALQPVNAVLQRIASVAKTNWTLMEVCGGQTHSLMKYGIVELLEPSITLIHGPGCPVCVTDARLIDDAILLAQTPGVILTTFGDLLRVPGTHQSLLSASTAGAQVVPVYSPIDAVRLAVANPDKQVVFFAVGFETTVPATALAVLQADRLKLRNFTVLNAHVRVLPAMELLAQEPSRVLDGFLAAGHVCAVTGWKDYSSFAAQHRVPVVITGFEPLDLLHGIEQCITLLENSDPTVINAYSRAVTFEGNSRSCSLISDVFTPADRVWRGLGRISMGGFEFQSGYRDLDAHVRFVDELSGDRSANLPHSMNDSAHSGVDMPVCIAGDILTGKRRPCDCPEFGRSCTPESPLGAPMVSSEGACAAWFRYRPAVS